MRKLLVIALMVALVPFMTGCRIGGLWGNDDDSGPDYPAGGVAVNNILNLGVQIPAGVVQPSVLASLANSSALDIEVYLKVVVSAAYPDGWRLMTKTRDADGNLFFTLQNVDASTVPSGQLTVKVTDGLTTYQYLIDTVAQTNLNVALPLTRVMTITSFNNDGTINYQAYSTANFAAGIFTPTGTASTVTSKAGTNLEDTTTYVAVQSVEVQAPGKTKKPLSMSSLNPTQLGTDDLNGVKFYVTFANDVTTATDDFSVQIDNLSNTTAAVTLTKAGTANDLVLEYANKVLTVTVNKAVALNAAGNYKITFVSSSAREGTKQINLPKYAYFKIGTVLNSWTVNGQTAPTAIPVQDPANANKTTVELTFGLDLQANQTIVGKVKLERQDNGAYVLLATVSAADNVVIAGNKVTMTFNQPLTAGKTYKVSYLSGSILDLNGNPVEIVRPIEFTTAQ